MITATLLDSMGTDLSVVNAARVSFGKESDWGWDEVEQRAGDGEWITQKVNKHLLDKDIKLIQYLSKHKHYSPFGHCFASFHIKAPIFVARQLVKHEYLRMNEISRRYVDTEPEFYVPEVWRGRAKDKKQGSEGIVTLQPITFVVDVLDIHQELNEASLDIYNFLLSQGVAPEMARMVLPQSMYTEWYWSGSMDAFANMCVLRLKDDTQYETRLVAQQIDKAMQNVFPVSWKALVHG